MTQDKRVRPFLKWAGNKYKVLPRIIQSLPPSKRLVEPFMGSGSLMLNRPTETYVGGDINKDLIDVFETIRVLGMGFIEHLKPLFSQERFDMSSDKFTRPGETSFYAARDEFNATSDTTRKAALFVFLNQHCFNGLCRYNRYGQFSTPYNLGFTAKGKPAEIQTERFAHTVEMLKGAKLYHASFEDVMVKAKRGDVIYCDPPYLPLDHKAGTFTDYTVDGFTFQQQELLARLADELREYGVTTVISNHSSSVSRELYRGADEIQFFDVKRSMGRYEGHANEAAELLAVYRARL